MHGIVRAARAARRALARALGSARRRSRTQYHHLISSSNARSSTSSPRFYKDDRQWHLYFQTLVLDADIGIAAAARARRCAPRGISIIIQHGARVFRGGGNVAGAGGMAYAWRAAWHGVNVS